MAPSRPQRTTAAISVVTAVAFLASMFAGPHIVWQAGFIPARLSQATPFVAVPFWLTPLSATLLHGGWLHLGFNLLMFAYCGRQVETVLGGLRLVIMYVLGAYGAAFAQFLVDPTSASPMIGASGAISAVIGSYALMFGRGTTKRMGPVSPTIVRALWLAAAWIVLQALIGLATDAGPTPIATAAHVGGFLTGLALTWPLLEWRYRRG